MKESLVNLIKNSFGFDPQESTHYFLVDIPRGADAPIKISEHLSWDEETGPSQVTTTARQDGQLRVLLARSKWDGIAEEMRASFNQRLKKSGEKIGRVARGKQSRTPRVGQGISPAGLGD